MRGRFEMDTTTMRVLVVEPGRRPIERRTQTLDRPGAQLLAVSVALAAVVPRPAEQCRTAHLKLNTTKSKLDGATLAYQALDEKYEEQVETISRQNDAIADLTAANDDLHAEIPVTDEIVFRQIERHILNIT